MTRDPARLVLPLLAALLLNSAATAQTVTELAISGDSANRIDMVVLGDGYTSSEMSKFASDANTVLATYFAEQPHAEYRAYYNVRRIDVASVDSGVSHPELGVSKNTAFGSYYDCIGIVRLICADENKVYNAVGVLPADQQDVIMLIVNDTTYGGSGGSFFITSMHIAAPRIALHELGHSLAHLADEYDSQPPPCADAVEPSQANATKQTDRTLVKWSAWIDASTPVPTTTSTAGVPGIYQGAMYCPTTLYRPTFNSIMRSVDQPYEQVNSEQIVLAFYSFVSPIDAASPVPSSSLSAVRGEPVNLTLSTPQPATHGLAATWYIDGQAQAGISSTSVSLSTSSLTLGTHTVSATLVDPTALVRNDPNQVLQESVSWTLTVLFGLYRPPRPGRYGGTSAAPSLIPIVSIGRATVAPAPPLSPLWAVPIVGPEEAPKSKREHRAGCLGRQIGSPRECGDLVWRR